MSQTYTPGDLASAGKKHFENGDFGDAARSYEAAAEGYRMAGDAINAAEMANNRSVCLLELGEAEEALNAVEGTPELFAEIGDSHRQALAYGNQAAALQALGRVDEAEAHYLQSADLLEQVGEDQLRATVLRSLSEMQLRSGRAIDAVISMQDGVSGVKKPRAQQRIIKKLLQMPNRFLG
ncbi:MAG: tetratricopeptide repeat protein [Anaerolineales bacterium]|nr:tetratricopeptide repeat protein [Anaerolineales bacterium]